MWSSFFLRRAGSGARVARVESEDRPTSRGVVRAMRANVVVIRRVIITFLVVAILAIGGVVGLSKAGVDVVHSRQVRDLRTHITDTFGSYFHKGEKPHEESSHHEQIKIVVTTPKVQDVTITDSFVCQIRSQRHIEVRALDSGYLKKISIKEGQSVKDGDVMFTILPVLYEAKFNAEVAEAEIARLRWMQAKKLLDDKMVSDQDVKLHAAELQKAEAKKELAKAELKFTEITAPFDGLVDRLLQREGSLIKEGDMLTTLADNSVMWVYFNVPEKYYLDYMATRKQRQKEDRIELMLANGAMFPQTGKIGAIEADFNNENGNIKFRADYPNPDSLLRHGQTGTIKIRKPLRNCLLIPQRATFELLDKRYAWVVDENDVAHQTLVTIKHELEDVFVIATGLKPTDKIILEGVREVVDGGKVEGYEFRKPEDALTNQKFHAE